MLWGILQILFRTRHSFLQLPEVLASNGSQLIPRGIFLLPSKRTAFTKIIHPPTASSYLTAGNCGSTKARRSFLDFGHLWEYWSQATPQQTSCTKPSISESISHQQIGLKQDYQIQKTWNGEFNTDMTDFESIPHPLYLPISHKEHFILIFNILFLGSKQSIMVCLSL